LRALKSVASVFAERNILVMGISAIFLNIAMPLYGTFLPLYFESLGVSIALFGGISSILAAARASIQVVGGHGADIYGRKTLIVTGGLVYAAALFPLFWVNSWYIAVLLLIITQLGIMLYQPGAQAMVSESVSAKKRATGFATFYFILGIGGLIAPVLGGYISLGGNYRFLFLIASLILFSVALSRLMFLEETKVEGQLPSNVAESRRNRLGFAEKIKLTWNSSTSTRVYIVFSLLSGISFNIAGMYYLFFYQKVIGMNELQIGISSTVFSVCMAITQIPGGMLSDKMGRKPLILMGLIVGPLTTLAMTQANAFYHIIIIEAISGCTVGLESASSMTLPTELVDKEYRATALGVFRAIDQAAAVIGPALGGLLVSYYAFEIYPKYVFYASILAGIPSTILFAVLIKETLQKEVSKKP